MIAPGVGRWQLGRGIDLTVLEQTNVDWRKYRNSLAESQSKNGLMNSANIKL